MLIRFLHFVLLPLRQLLQAMMLALVLGSVFFVIGELLPRKIFNYTAFPFSSFTWEKRGQIYQKIRIHKWKDQLPDMSQYIKTMFSKKITSPRDPQYTHHLILETCVAELIHYALIFASPLFCRYMLGIYGNIAALLYALSNVPFILIQRYNRPRLIRLMEKQISALERAEKKHHLFPEHQVCNS